MGSRGNDADEILPGLWIGNRVAALDPDFLARKKITAVFNCTKDIPFAPSIYRQYRIPVDDNLKPEEIRNLELWSYEITYKMSAEVRRAAAAGEAVLVHCHAGMQRSAASVAIYLIAVKGVSTDAAIAFIQSKRPITFRPLPNFERAIRGFEKSFNDEIRPRLEEGIEVVGPQAKR